MPRKPGVDIIEDVDPSRLSVGQKNFIIELDGCVCAPLMSENKMASRDALNAVPLIGARNWVNRRFEEGHVICFFTARPEKLRTATEKWLRTNGFRYHSLVMNKPTAKKYHYIDDRRVQATTFNGKFTPLVVKEETIEVF